MDVIVLLKFIATLLITNSHMGVIYPDALRPLASGGTIGNALFFFISGYSLFFSDISISQKWFAKRMLRIMIPYWLFLFVKVLLGEPFQLIHLISPTYWFLQAILIFYVLYYFIMRYLKDRLLIVFGTVLLIYIVYFFSNRHNFWLVELTGNPMKTHWFYYFLIMVFGAIIAYNKEFVISIRIKFIHVLFALILSVVIYYLSKYIVIRYSIFSFQFLIPCFLFVISLLLFYLFSVFRTKSNSFIDPIIRKAAEITLEIYLVQFIIINFFSSQNFSHSSLFAWCAIFLAALSLNYLSTLLQKKLFMKLGI